MGDLLPEGGEVAGLFAVGECWELSIEEWLGVLQAAEISGMFRFLKIASGSSRLPNSNSNPNLSPTPEP